MRCLILSSSQALFVYVFKILQFKNVIGNKNIYVVRIEFEIYLSRGNSKTYAVECQCSRIFVAACLYTVFTVFIHLYFLA